MVIAASDGRGFLATQDGMIGNTKKGKMLLNVDAPAKAQFVVPVEGDMSRRSVRTANCWCSRLKRSRK